jgi:hypothetical protein
MHVCLWGCGCRLVLQSRRDGAAHAASLVFLVRSQPCVRSPLKRVRVEGPMYELQHFEFSVVNPFQAGQGVQVAGRGPAAAIPLVLWCDIVALTRCQQADKGGQIHKDVPHA